MTGKRRIHAALLPFLLAVALLGLFGHSRAAPDAAVSTAFTYQGRLILSGTPVNGLCDFQFSLWDAAVAGGQVGGTVSSANVAVSDGLFTVSLDFGPGIFAGDARWLEVSVRCPAGAGVYTLLAPRQVLTATPYAIYSLSTAEHNHWGETWTSAADAYGLRLLHTAVSGSTSGIVGQSASTAGRGVMGVASASTGTNFGVWGQASSGTGRGVFGDATAGSGFALGVYGRSASTGGRGVFGEATASSGQAFGVHGQSASTDGRAVFGWATAVSGSTYGMVGQADSPTGTGVQGYVSSATGASTGVWGHSLSSSGKGVLGTAAATTGTNYGVYGQSQSVEGYGVYGVAWATTGSNVGVYGRSLSTGGYAGYFTGKGADAVVIENSGSGRGLYVQAMDDTAVWAQTDTGLAGVDGRASGATGRGVYGYATAATGDNQGVYGRTSSSDGRGVYGWASAGTGTNYGVYGRTSSAAGYAGYFQGNLHTTGTLTKAGGAFKIDHPLDPANQYLYHSFVESPDMKNIYDGVAVLDADGAATVTLPDWFEALNRDFRYQLTPVGAAMPNLHVAQQMSANTFRIAGGAPGLEVSWQVTGIRHDAYANAHRIPVEEPKPEAERGLYLHPAELGQPIETGFDHQFNAAAQQADDEQ